MCIPVSTVPRLSVLRSAAGGDFSVGYQDKATTRHRAFCVAGPVAWNSLPLHIRSAPTLLGFKTQAQDTSFLTFLLH